MTRSAQSARFSRRVFFRGMLLTAAALTAVPVVTACARNQQQPPRGYDEPARDLPIPPLAQSQVTDGVRTFSLEAAAATAEILPGIETKTWGYSSPVLGPTLRARRGEKVKVEVLNSLEEVTTVHWHGMKLPAKADGGPHSPIEPGDTWSPQWTVEQPAATLWYHPHPHERTALHCYRGLAGLFLVDDEVSDGLDLPSDYGVDDIPVVITDAKFTEDGQLDETIDPNRGLLGTTPVINGITRAQFTATTRRVRLRVVNGASMRFYQLALDNDSQLAVVATDSGFLSAPMLVDSLIVGPGERAEVIVDIAPGEEVILRSIAHEDNFGLPDDGADTTVDFGFQDEFDLLVIHGPAESSPEPGPLPQQLDPAADEVPNAQGLIERDFVLNTFMINGQSMDMARVDVTIDHARPEIWRVENENADWPHNFHIHNARFQVLDFTGTAVKVPTFGWKDVVALPPKGKATLLVEFGHHPDPSMPYMYHCHMLLHEDSGMMGQFVMVDPGQTAELSTPGLDAAGMTMAGDGAGSGAPVGGGDGGASASKNATVPKGNPGGHQSNLGEVPAG